jgi:hypothetical protein
MENLLRLVNIQIETIKRLISFIAQRKMWKKYDSPGPNPDNFIITEEVFMQFVRIEEISAPEGGQKVTRCTCVLAPPTLKLTGGEYIPPNVKVGE